MKIHQYVNNQPYTSPTHKFMRGGREGAGKERERERERRNGEKKGESTHHVSGDLDLSETQYRPGGTGFLDPEIPSLESFVA
jgi:hypothetical protein